MKKTLFLTLFIGLLGIQLSMACTNFLVTKGASATGSTLISYAADSHVLYGELYYWPAATYSPGSMLDIYEWDTGKFLGQIEQATETYNVVGNMNEYQVAIGETTYGGRKELGSQKGAIMDYGSLIYVALQRSKTAREAVAVIGELMDTYGYYSSGESFSISDPNEVWYMELIGKGEGEKGAVWVALLIPDGYVSAHANQARIQTFPINNKKIAIPFSKIDKINKENITCVYADDVVDFARNKGWFDGKDEDFSFSDTYAPVDFGGARFCEVRVWSFFRSISDDMDQYFEYASGHDLKNRMPLWIKPNKKLDAKFVMDAMRDHLEDTPLDMRKDFGAGPYENPYRWRPLTWEVDGVTYCNERATATQQTGFVFVAEAKSWIPEGLGGVLWFGVDDAASTVFVPMFTSLTKVPENYAVGNGSMMEWSDNAAFWIFNQVSNFAYTRYNLIHPDIALKQNELELSFITEVEKMEKEILPIFNENGKDAAIEKLNSYSNYAASTTFSTWKTLYQDLFVKFMDGNVKTAREVPEGYKYITPDLKQPGYSEEFYKKVVEETGDHFKMGGEMHH